MSPKRCSNWRAAKADAVDFPENSSPVARLIAERTGTDLSRQQKGRLSQAIDTRLNGRTEQAYLDYLKSPSGAPELTELMAVISVHKTDLFRDERQLEAVAGSVFPDFARLGRPARVWSAGCATGEEVATLLVMLTEAGAHPESTVLGTDISNTALGVARQLSFARDSMRRVPSALVGRYFEEREGRFTLTGRLRQRAHFMRHNLMDTPYPFAPNTERFDLIFCRNVLIYFTESAFDSVVDNLAERLQPTGALVLSSAEPILRPRGPLKTVRTGEAFFYVPRQGALPKVPQAPPPRPSGPPRPVFVEPTESPVVQLPKAFVPISAPRPTAEMPAINVTDEAVRLFQAVLEMAADGKADAETEARLRKALYLAPDLVAARYLLGLMLEQRSARADAATEYRRALATFRDGKAVTAAFFLNLERLQAACTLALERLGFKAA